MVTYDYTKDTFIIGDTDIEIAWKNIVASEMITIKELYFNTDKVVLKSIQYPRIQMRIKLKCLDGEWLMILSDPSKPNDAATPSDEFLEILFENWLNNQEDNNQNN